MIKLVILWTYDNKYSKHVLQNKSHRYVHMVFEKRKFSFTTDLSPMWGCHSFLTDGVNIIVH